MNQVLLPDGRTVIHLHVLIGDRLSVACMPGEVNLGSTPQHANYQMSGDPRAVNCPACEKTTLFERERKRVGG